MKDGIRTQEEIDRDGEEYIKAIMRRLPADYWHLWYTLPYGIQVLEKNDPERRRYPHNVYYWVHK